MKHKEIQKQLISLLDGSLSEELKNQVELHLKECAECRYLHEELSKDLYMMDKDRVVDSDPYFYTRLKAKMEQSEAKNISWKKRVLQPAFLSLMIMAAVVFGIQLAKEVTSLPQTPQNEVAVMLPFDGLSEEPIEQFLLTFE